MAYGGSSAPSGWQICNGGTASTSALQTVLGQSNVPDLRDRFIVGAGSSYSSKDTGGSKDAVLVTHTHNLQNHVHGINLTTNNPGNHTHSYTFLQKNDGDSLDRGGNNAYSRTTTSATTSGAGGHTHTVSGNTGTPSTNTTDTLGESATNKNLQPYYALIYIIKTMSLIHISEPTRQLYIS